MERFKKFIKRNVYLFFSLVTFVTSLLFAGIVLIVFSVTQSVRDTSVGHIYIGNQSKGNYVQILNKEVSTWQQNIVYQAKYQDYIFEFDTHLFEFDADQTVSNIKENQRNTAVFNLNETNKQMIYNDMSQFFSNAFMVIVDFDILIEQVKSDLNKLVNVKTYQMFEYLDVSEQLFTINDVLISNLDSSDVDDIIASVDTFVIPMSSRFSLLNTLNQTTLSNQQLSIIASGLLKVSQATSFSGFIFEKYNQLPVWSSPGMNVRILRVNQYDLTFFNQQIYDYHVHIEQVDHQSINISIKGYPYIHLFEIDTIVKSVIPFDTIYIEDLTVNENTPNVEVIDLEDMIIYRVLQQAGVDGSVIFYMRTTRFLNKDAQTVKIFDEQFQATPQIYREQTVMKEGA